ncbi:unnamed protein product [Arctia plantaginis]|uniref:Kazal-like domain-containing protein n=1 Tax=Arctia plantaginis TaxID=874455 RepID=A0A8S1BR12_ARCPL|nr:unnamed protein product [Arctia plantaginis]
MCFHEICGKLTALEKIEYCQTLQCDETMANKVCGIIKQNGIKTYRLFDDECLLLKYGCQVKDGEEAYGIIDMKYCIEHTQQEQYEINCPKNCDLNLKEPVCGIRKTGKGFTIKIFSNKCQLAKYNCEQRLQFSVTDYFICNRTINHKPLFKHHSEDEMKKIHASLVEEIHDGQNSFDKKSKELAKSWSSTEVTNNYKTSMEEANKEETSSKETINNESYTTETNSGEISTINTADTDDVKITNEILLEDKTTNTPLVKNKTIHKNIVIIRGSMTDMQNINTTADNFFAATHVFDLPVREIYPNLTDVTRRRLIHIFGPTKVFIPWMTFPETIKDDYYHKPTLGSCLHKCPQKCPNTYAPVCGVPGIVAREPSIMFQNHCYMDVAQCKMFWEDKSETAQSSAYVESSFLFCIGDQLNGVYRFLPLIRTLQHMGRLRTKGKYKYRSKNMRFLNQLLSYDPKLMG